MTELLFIDEGELVEAGLSLATASAISSVVNRDMTDYVALNYAGDPNGNIAANFSRLCIDTTNDFLYYNLGVATASTVWTKIVV